MALRKNYLPDGPVETIYFGGGTPSLLLANQLEEILSGIQRNFRVLPQPEITIEVNPDDVTAELLNGYGQIGINRISIGVQSFIDSELALLGRRHNAARAMEAVNLIHRADFDNISVDLIYGIPGSTPETWNKNLSTAVSLDIQHLSCYHLTYEEATPLMGKLEKGKVIAVDEEESANQFNILRTVALQNNFVHYEVSNFAREGFYSKHNSSYWRGVPYLGLGPSAHSYNIKTRAWNPSSYSAWSSAVGQNMPQPHVETIDEDKRFNELLITRLRTIWGVDLNFIANDFDKKYVNHLRRVSEKHLAGKNLMLQDNSVLIIPPEKYFTSDSVVADLLYM